MAQEVRVCVTCERQNIQNDFCPVCGSTQTVSLDYLARKKDGTMERELREKAKSDSPKITKANLDKFVTKQLKTK